MARVGVLGLALAPLVACSSGPRSSGSSADPVASVASRLAGSFSSGSQSRLDPDFLDIRLNSVRIWPKRTDGSWLYVEQASAEALDRPYRQRVYHVTAAAASLAEASNGQGPVAQVRSAVFELPGDPLAYAGAWRQPERFDAISPEQLAPRSGCDVLLNWDAARKAWIGGTEGSGCASTLRGSAYATSEVVLLPDRMETWDRGFAADGMQVWGSAKGPYIFRRASEDSDDDHAANSLRGFFR